MSTKDRVYKSGAKIPAALARALMENAVEIALAVAEREFSPEDTGLNEWICEAAMEFEDLYRGKVYDDQGDYYNHIHDWTVARMVAHRMEQKP